jgi:uncharacterized protein
MSFATAGAAARRQYGPDPSARIGRNAQTAVVAGVTDRAGRPVDAALLLVVGSLAVYTVLRSTVIASGAHFAANLLLATGVLVAGLAIGLRSPDLGLEREHLGSGVRLGLLTAGLIAAAVALAAALPATAGFFGDNRVEVPFAEMALRVAVVIPLGTVLVEELVFRGVLHGLLRGRFDIGPATLWGATAFGLWHVLPAWRSYDVVAFGELGRWGAVVGTFVATFIAGLGFTWLRHRSGHLIAPVIAHIAINSVAFAVAWLLAWRAGQASAG